MDHLYVYGGPRQTCPAELQCSEWIFAYLGDCVCSHRDLISFILGLTSVAMWGVAEIPQIIKNFSVSSTEGLSLTFLLTWTVGDIFNLVGCYLEPATLPTQFYMAFLYSVTTFVLVGQTIWFEVLLPRQKSKTSKPLVKKLSESVLPELSAQLPCPPGPGTSSRPTATINVPLSRKPSTKEIYISSARSLVSGHTPTLGSYRPGSQGIHSGGGGGGHSILSQSPGYGLTHNLSTTRTLVMGALLLHGGIHFLSWHDATASQGAGMVVSRKLLELSGFQNNHLVLGIRQEGSSTFGQLLGWIMAAIYMGGRIPQIWLNSQRGSVEGLSPLMFLFALLGNSTYVSSILVRSLDWTVLQPNLPWLVDAGVCVLLDLLILCQFLYFKLKNGEEDTEEDSDDEDTDYFYK